MGKNSQYKDDLMFIQRVESVVSKKAEIITYYIGLVACFIVHILYLGLFAANEVKEMVVFNVFSVLFYAIMLVLVTRAKDRVHIIYLALAEIMLHASVATSYVGSKPDFGMFLLMIIPIAFFIPNSRKHMAFGIMFISLVLYGVLGFVYSDPEMIPYDFDDRSRWAPFYIINFIIGSFVLVYVMGVYTIRNRYLESVMRIQNEQLRINAYIDPLTQLSNRRAMGEDLKNVHSESQITGKSYVIGLGDIDDFKEVNDTYGHDFGDSVLSAVADIIKENIPDHGYAARWGGEEFLFVIPASDVQEGSRCADRILHSIRQYEFRNGDSVFSVTMTFGVCEGMPEDEIDKIISHADRRLYKGKNSGKNRTQYTD